MSSQHLPMDTLGANGALITHGSADGPGDEERGNAGPPVLFCNHKHHRRLAVCSVICGLSCIGIHALKYSFMAEHARGTEKAKNLSRRAKKWSVISIVTWVSIIVSIPILMALFSYLATLKD
ncbi:transmembrane protein 265-like [Nematolebias whitei]|uniref:transmembrane protein 265-like n=1 Tax=Nematolebias whitei TaxID=451745 RepID=UPI00189925C8|nr:transmembrane protein 265-like [Nematolebias whitei]